MADRFKLYIARIGWGFIHGNGVLQPVISPTELKTLYGSTKKVAVDLFKRFVYGEEKPSWQFNKIYAYDTLEKRWFVLWDDMGESTNDGFDWGIVDKISAKIIERDYQIAEKPFETKKVIPETYLGFPVG